MNKSVLTNQEISFSVNQTLKNKEWSVRDCCKAFNLANAERIKRSEITSMDKDFLQRVRSNKFQVVTKRVSDLCDFLKIDLGKNIDQKTSAFLTEFRALEDVVKNNPKLELTLRNLLLNVAEVLTINEAR